MTCDPPPLVSPYCPPAPRSLSHSLTLPLSRLQAIVNHAALRQVLNRLDPNASVYLGDFGEWTHAMGVSRDYHNASIPATQLRWNPPYACGGSGTVFSRAAVRQTNFFRCAVRYHVGCFQSDWMIGRCAAEARVMPMVMAESCGLCVRCDVVAHQQRRRSLARLRNDANPPCFALTTCDHHLPEPLLYELCLLLPRRTPIMHGCEGCQTPTHAPCLYPSYLPSDSGLILGSRFSGYRMCAQVLSGPVFPSLIRRYSSSPTPITSVMNYLRLPSNLRLGLLNGYGVKQLEDLLDILPQDLDSLGFSTADRTRFLSAVWDGGPMHSMVRSAVRNETKIHPTLDGMRLQGWGSDLTLLGVRTASDLRTLSDADLRSINMSLVERRRVQAIIRHLTSRPAGSGLALSHTQSAQKLLTELRKNLARAAFNAPDPADECDCTWTGGPNCVGHKDDGTKCWAVCCPNRGPRFGVWQHALGGVMHRVKGKGAKRKAAAKGKVTPKETAAPAETTATKGQASATKGRANVQAGAACADPFRNVSDNATNETRSCDCSWRQGGPACANAPRDDGTVCWAVCCPARPPRFGNWQLTVFKAKRLHRAWRMCEQAAGADGTHGLYTYHWRRRSNFELKL